MKNIFRRISAPIGGNLVEREENCRICNEKMGEQIAVVDYWDIKTARLIKCSKCNHIQLDPMLTDSEISKGCNAYYIEESARSSDKEECVNFVRNFRRGVVFGYSLKRKKISPRSVLELGPGSGYFSAGLKFVFPNVDITIMDINLHVINFNQEHHKFKIIHDIPDHFIEDCTNKFDLVVARDIIEHVSDISKVVKNVNRYLTSDGFFHFITPNGHEDVWKHYLTSILTDSASELLINHVNYYDGKGLKAFLIKEGFIPVDYYTYTIKTTLRGNGWEKNQKLMSPVSIRKNADSSLMRKGTGIYNIELKKEKILDKWYIQDRAKWITYIFSIYQHFSIIRINPELNIGHEIYGLFKKN
ncbi:MAG: class I SAM-dependent methyltransferase [Bacteroidales bacterium]